MRTTNPLAIYGILAYPAGHSLSPQMHNFVFEQFKIPAKYERFEIAPADLSEFMADFRKNQKMQGFSVSLPHKEAIIPLLDVIDDSAEMIGAVNTVLKAVDGTLLGSNTDWLGSNRSLTEVCGDLNNKKVAVIGAGGAGKAIVYGLKKSGAEIAIYNRDKKKAQELAEKFQTEFYGDFSDLLHFKQADILVQATSVWILDPQGLSNAWRILTDENLLQNSGIEAVMDIVYKPLITPLLANAAKVGIKTITGDKMLAYQAEGQFELWTGKKANGLYLEWLEEILEANR